VPIPNASTRTAGTESPSSVPVRQCCYPAVRRVAAGTASVSASDSVGMKSLFPVRSSARSCAPTTVPPATGTGGSAKYEITTVEAAPRGRQVHQRDEVIDCGKEIGFAIRFIRLGHEVRDRIADAREHAADIRPSGIRGVWDGVERRLSARSNDFNEDAGGGA